MSVRISTLVGLIVMTCLVQALDIGCRQAPQPVCEEFFALSTEQGEKVFPTFPLDRQLEILRCGVYRRPPTIGLEYQIAKGGEKIIPRLTDVLWNEKDEWMQAAIVEIFRVMSDEGHLNGKIEVIQAIDNAVTRMKDPYIRREAEEALSKIRNNAERSGP